MDYICKEDYNSSNIVFPSRFPGFAENLEKSSYYSTAQKLKDFQDINELPPFLRNHVEHYESANTLALDFIQNKAVFHKNYVSNYNKQKYDRKLKQKRVSTAEAEVPETPRTSRRKVCTKDYSKKSVYKRLLEEKCVQKTTRKNVSSVTSWSWSMLFILVRQFVP